MRRAFTLIELLVVIAIIAILAAILFPVFAQAKSAAKKTVAVSNMKQISTSLTLYTTDSDDIYPRNDDCTLNSSLNSAFNTQAAGTNPAPWCNGSQSFAFRMNHYTWQKWVLPYMKNVTIFEHPGRPKIDDRNNATGRAQWSGNGQIMGGYALNLGLTGAINTWNRANTASGRLRNSFLGGSQSALPDVAGAMIFFEFTNKDINFSPVTIPSSESSSSVQTVYPFAIREYWTGVTKKLDQNCNATGEDDPRLVFGGVMVVGFADGSAKALKVDDFLARTPTARDFGVPLNNNLKCGYMYDDRTSGGSLFVSTGPSWSKSWPFWGLE
jgi:prepilin-type N-terminal cleavage/methylation domain-containing protein